MLRGWNETESLVYLERFAPETSYEMQQYMKYILLMSLLLFGAIVGSIFFGFVTMKLGRKVPLLLISAPLIVEYQILN